MGCRKLTYYESKTAIGENWKIFASGIEKTASSSIFCKDYYAGGFPLPGRHTVQTSSDYDANGNRVYRYGYQGSEKDFEITNVTGAHITTYFREGDTRLLKWWSNDPKTAKQPWQSPYSYMDNNPIWFNDPLGDEVKGKTKKDAEKTKKQMANSLEKQGEELVNKFFTIDDDNKLVYTGKNGAEMTHYMNKTGEYRDRKGDKFTSKQKAMARGYMKMTKAKSFSIEVEFKEDLAIDESGFVATGKRTGAITIGEATPHKKILDVNNEPHSPGLTQTFVHELLGEAYIAATYEDMKTLWNLANDISPKKRSAQPQLRSAALHIIQAENLYKGKNSVTRSGVNDGHWIPIHPDDVDKVNGIPEPFK
ncbi:MAG: hypothetical protein COA31_002390 [Flavobacteriales bacterium]|nr:hypothetical protein [Flavobacteriales bacterium]